MSTVSQLSEVTRKPNQELIATLERYLELARTGKLLSLGIVADVVGSSWNATFAGGTDKRIESAMLISLALRHLGFDASKI